jgi:hypothetical protein
LAPRTARSSCSRTTRFLSWTPLDCRRSSAPTARGVQISPTRLPLMSWAAGRAIESTRGEISATASHSPDTQRRHTVACISSEPEHPAVEPLSDGHRTAATAAQQSTCEQGRRTVGLGDQRRLVGRPGSGGAPIPVDSSVGWSDRRCGGGQCLVSDGREAAPSSAAGSLGPGDDRQP